MKHFHHHWQHHRRKWQQCMHQWQRRTHKRRQTCITSDQSALRARLLLSQDTPQFNTPPYWQHERGLKDRAVPGRGLAEEGDGRGCAHV
eukprot:1114554-Rhodomonas_salina.1